MPEGSPKMAMPLLRESQAAGGGHVVNVTSIAGVRPVGSSIAYSMSKAALNQIEQGSPGSKAAFYLNFLDNMAPLLAGRSAAATEELGTCSECGSPTTSDLCAFCRTAQKARAHDPVPVELVLHRGRRRR